MSSSTLPFFDDTEVERVLCVVAHPDDMEYGGSAAVARWTSLGVRVSYLLLTAGEAGMRSRPPQEVGPLRAAEQRAACAAVGVEDLTILDLPDGTVEASLETRKHIARHIRRTTPDVVITQPWAAQWLLVPGSPAPDQLTDVSGKPLQQAVESLEAHAEYLAELGGDFSPAAMLEEITASAARQSSLPQVSHALAVQAHRM